MVEVRENSLAFWHARLCILVASYSRSAECIEKHGTNTNAALKQDGSAVVIATSKGYLLFLRVLYEGPSSSGPSLAYFTREHGIVLQRTSSSECSEGTEMECVTLKYFNETAVVGGVQSLFCLGTQLVVATGYGVLHRLNWEGKFDVSLAIVLSQVPLANDLLPESRGQPLGEVEVKPKDVVYSPEMHGISLVLNDGRGVFISAKSAKYEPQSLQGVVMKDLSNAVCTAVNPRYRLLAFGKENGAVDVFGVDDTTGAWSLSHTLQFTRQQFPETGVRLGAVQCMEWSFGDRMVIAVSWRNGGLSLWSVFGALLLCSLGDQPGTPSPLNPHCTILESMCWSSDGYHLWMLPTEASWLKSRDSEGDLQPVFAGGSKRSSLSGTETDSSARSSQGEEPTKRRLGSAGSHRNGFQGDGKATVMVMRFLKNSIVNNPITANHEHLFLQGSDRLYLNTSKTVVARGNYGVGSAGPPPTNGMVSSPQWKVVQLPSSYLVLNWPVKYAAVNSSGTHVAVSGKAGFALYSGFKGKWKLFGNELQEQSLVCRGGLLWFREVVVFPCRVQEKYEEVRFYSLHSNLDNSQLLHTLKLTSPIVKLNLLGNHLLLGSRDCHMSIYSLNTTVVPSKGLVLSVSKLHELSLAQSLPHPWATSLIAMVPSTIRTEPGVSKESPRPIESVMLNVSGKLLMLQQDLPNPYAEQQEEWLFSFPVCLATSVEAMWTPPLPSRPHPPEEHLMESLWLACGATGIKVWLPLFPRDECHPSFLSKRIMLTLPVAVYPQAVLFHDAVLFGLSHETAFTDALSSSKHSFPFAIVERTTHIFLHHILRQLLRRNLGSHALQIARSCSHLPYFAHVLELMLHEVLEEEAPGAMPVPDALLPRVVEFIKQFPEFLETVGSCARKTEVALWQYLFAAVGNPRDLFELCISDDRLKTAATYLIIIQNLETATVSRQLATRLLDAALDNSQWELCKDLVRFLRAIGPCENVETPLHGGHHTPATPLKTPLAPPTSTPTTAVPPSPQAPDLDRSAMSVTRDHLSSGSTSSVVSFSGEYRDASGRVIRRPQFVMEVDSKEEYFMELILSRHARKLLMARCLRDLGRFAAHLDFNLQGWMGRERLRAARIDDFVATLRELHKQFQWPFPSGSYTASRASEESYRETQKDAKRIEHDNLSPGAESKSEATPLATPTFSPDPDSIPDSDTASVSSIKRSKRPPDLDLSPGKISTVLAPKKLQGLAVDAKGQGVEVGAQLEQSSQGDFDPTRSSTPTKHSGSISERVSLVNKNPSSVDLQVDASSLGDILEETDWDLGTDVSMATTPVGTRGPAQAEKEIRYFIEVALEASCMEWSVVLGLLLLDMSVVSRTMECARRQGGVDRSLLASIMQGIEDVYAWAESECPGYLKFLEALHPYMEQLKTLSQISPKTPVAPASEEPDQGVFLEDDSSGHSPPETAASPSTEDQNASVCTIS